MSQIKKEKKLLDWREDIGEGLVKDSQNYNLEDIYEHAHSELSL